ncbi:MAG: carboxypeptidase regulatory-like domain-containing protein [Desulfobacteraceae bacterium]
MARYGMLINCNHCIGCYNCFLTCQDEFCGNTYEGYAVAAPMEGHNYMRVIDKERGRYPRVKVAYIPKTCMHCKNAKCIEAAENGAVYRRSDGIVVIDPVKAVGQKQIVDACPYRVIEWNEKEKVPQKCNMCAHLLDKGEKQPRCVESCPTNAIVFGDLDDDSSEISQLLKLKSAEKLCPEFNLKEKVLYLGLPKRFISGTVVYQDKKECVNDLQVELQGENETRTTRTNMFGDFEFEGLEANQSFLLKISQPGYKEENLPCNTTADIHTGEIYLIPKA